jgi:hypothetical protein
VFGGALQPGLIAPQEFYKTYSPVQSKFSWGTHGFQTGTQFDAKAWNQAAASETPWGIQELAKPMSAEDIMATINGTYKVSAPGPVATRMEAYNAASYPQASGIPTVARTTSGGATGGATGGTTGAVAPRLTTEQLGLVGEYRNIGLTDDQIASIIGVSVESIRNASQP